MKFPEILAPAGSTEALTAALRTGADAVYLGGKSYSARNNASNFTDEELSEAVRLCHIHGAKLYLAVNTLISDNEIGHFCDFIKKTAEYGVDGYIVQDIGAADIIRSAVPDAVLHGSTQLSVHTVSGVRQLKEMGFSRVVPARELSADTLERICREDIETEVFVHGALCMSVSGQCYMSAVIGSRSANRGCCGQACRLPFSANGNKNSAALSLKDLSLLEHTDKLREIGVDSLKIEGRMKRPEYIASAVSELKKAFDGKSPDMKTLRGIFSRSGFTDGYFTEKRQNMFGVREKEDVIAADDAHQHFTAMEPHLVLRPLQGLVQNILCRIQRGGINPRRRAHQHAIVLVEPLQPHHGRAALDFILRAQFILNQLIEQEYPRGSHQHVKGCLGLRGVFAGCDFPQLAGQLVLEFLDLQGLEEIGAGAVADGLLGQGKILIAAEDNKPGSGAVFTRLANDLQPVHQRHFDINHRQIGPEGQHHGQGLLAIGGCADDPGIVVLPRYGFCQAVADRRLVVCNQYGIQHLRQGFVSS